MKRARLLLGVGVWVAVLPHLGFPYMIKNTLFLFTGFLLVYMAFVVYRQIRSKEAKSRVFENFTENGGEVQP